MSHLFPTPSSLLVSLLTDKPLTFLALIAGFFILPGLITNFPRLSPRSTWLKKPPDRFFIFLLFAPCIVGESPPDLRSTYLELIILNHCNFSVYIYDRMKLKLTRLSHSFNSRKVLADLLKID